MALVRILMDGYSLLLCGLLLACIPTAHASEPANPTPTPQPERWLIVVDVSAPMRHRATAVRNALASLLDSRFGSQLQDGHEIGLWTFNDQLHADKDPWIWSEARHDDITREILSHVASQKYARETRFVEVMTTLQPLVKGSRRLTVILVSDGDENILGTPCDELLAAFFLENSAGARTRRVPILTILRVFRGQWLGCEQSMPPWPVVFPAFPPEPDPTSARPAVTTTPTERREPPPQPQPKVIYGEPLIVRGPERPPREEPPPPEPQDAVADLAEAPETNGPADTSSWTTTPGSPETEAPAPALPSTTPVEGRLSWVALGTVGGVGVAASILVLGLLRKRNRGRGRASLITKSMDEGDGGSRG